MKAMYITAPGQVEIRHVAMPVRKKGQVLLKILYGGICGSDLGSYRGTFAYFDYPRIPGHEFSAQVIEAVGLPSTFQNCMDACCFGGRMVLIGVGKNNLDFNFTLIQKKELNVYGSRNALKKDFLELTNLVNAGKVPLEKIITHVYPFHEAAKAFEDFSGNPGNMLKVILDFSDL